MLSLNGFEIEALRLSLKVALWSVSLSLPVGFGVAWILARKHFPGKILVDGKALEKEFFKSWREKISYVPQEGFASYPSPSGDRLPVIGAFGAARNYR